MQRSRRSEALELARKGYSLVPLNGKVPIVADWVSKASSDRNYVGHTWTEHPDANIGIATGGPLVVLDMDPRNGGDTSLQKLEAKIGPLPEPTVLTGGGGKHWYFTVPTNVSTRKLLPGLDLRGDGAQVVAPPSTHPTTGLPYVFVNGASPTPCPERLFKFILKKQSDPGTTQESSSTSDFLAPGSRNENLTRLAGSMRRLGASQNEIEIALISLAKECGLPVREAIRTAASIARKSSGVEEEIAQLVHQYDVREEAQRRRRQRDIQLIELTDETLEDVLKRPLEPTPFSVATLHPTGGNTLFIAQRKAGKTTVAMNLVRCLADKDPFLNEFEVQPAQGRIAYLNYELNPNQCHQWIKDMSIEHERRVSVLNLRGVPGCLWLTYNREKLIKWLIKREISTLIIDPAGRAWQGVVDNENDNTQLRQFTTILDEIKQEADVPDLVLIHHIGKSHTEEGSERGRGGSALEDWPDAIWTLTKDESGTRSFSAEGRDVELEPTDLDYDPYSRDLSVAGTRAVRRAQDRQIIQEVTEASNITKLLASVAELKAASKQAVKNHVGWGNTTNQKMMQRALKEGLIQQVPGPRNSMVVSLTEAGQDELTRRSDQA